MISADEELEEEEEEEVTEGRLCSLIMFGSTCPMVIPFPPFSDVVVVDNRSVEVEVEGVELLLFILFH